MNFNEELKNLREEKRTNISELNYLEEKKQEEITSSINSINDKYRDDILNVKHNINYSYNTVDNYCRLIDKFSMFNDSKYIIEAISHIIKIYEGEEYVYQNTYYHYDSKRSILIDDVTLLVKKDKIKDKYDFHYFKSLIKHKNVLILAYEDIYRIKNIKFYKYNNCNIIPTIKYGKFNYIKEFIDYVISYKIENYKEDITEEEINKLKIEFIESKINDIYEYHNKLSLEETKELEKEITMNKNRRNKILSRIIRRK